MRRCAWPCSLSLLILLSIFKGPAWAGDAWSVVVLDVQMGEGVAGGEMQAGLADRLAKILGKTGRFQVIPRAQFSAALAAQEAETKRPCRDQQCQLQLALKMGAQGAIQTEVAPDGQGCSVNLTLLDAASSSAMASSSVKNKCSPVYMITAMDGAIAMLISDVNSGHIQPGQSPKPQVDQAEVEKMTEKAKEAAGR